MTPLSAGPPNIINASDAANHHVSSVMISGSAQGIVRWLILAAVLSQAACSWQPESMRSANRGAAVDLKVTAERINALGRVEPILFGTNFAPGDWHDICAMPSCVPVRFPGWHGGSDGQTTSTSFAAE